MQLSESQTACKIGWLVERGLKRKRQRERERGRGRKWEREKGNAKRPGSQGPLVHSHGGNQREERKRKQDRQGGIDRERRGKGPTSMLHINSSGCDPM